MLAWSLLWVGSRSAKSCKREVMWKFLTGRMWPEEEPLVERNPEVSRVVEEPGSQSWENPDFRAVDELKKSTCQRQFHFNYDFGSQQSIDTRQKTYLFSSTTDKSIASRESSNGGAEGEFGDNVCWCGEFWWLRTLCTKKINYHGSHLRAK